MAFITFTSVSDAARAIQDFLFDRDAALPDDVREQLRDLVGPTTSPVDAIVRGAEILYSRKNELAPEALELAAGLALVAQQYNFHNMAVDNRGSRMALAMMRKGKVKPPVGVTYPDEKEDPIVRPEFAPVQEVRIDPNTPAPALAPVPTPVEDAPRAEGARRG